MMEGAEPVTDGEIAVSLTESADEVAIEVLDNGPGVPPGAAEQIFTDGFTTKTKDVDRGAGDALRRGVGLALVRQLVRRLGGEITVTEGPGARFTARLPKQAPAGQEAAGQARGGHEVAASGATTAERPQ
ncbi:MAG: ATP-binding protein [Actinomycetia bacterium]|nr:ATP-binding protein [Actinomycetes bacterium]